MEKTETKATENTELTTTLFDTLEAKKVNFEANAPEDKKKIYAEGIAAVKSSGILEKAINIGDTAPNFTLNNAQGKKVTLYEELKKGPIILLWYRGGWCPYCNLTLKYMQDWLPKFRAEGANILALTPELPDSSLSTSEKHSLQFEVLSDLKNEVARKYSVVFKLTPAVAEKYQQGFNLHAYNGDVSDELPLAATYIIGKDAIVRYAFLDADYRNRAEPSKILEALKKK